MLVTLGISAGQSLYSCVKYFVQSHILRRFNAVLRRLPPIFRKNIVVDSISIYTAKLKTLGLNVRFRVVEQIFFVTGVTASAQEFGTAQTAQSRLVLWTYHLVSWTLQALRSLVDGGRATVLYSHQQPIQPDSSPTALIHPARSRHPQFIHRLSTQLSTGLR